MNGIKHILFGILLIVLAFFLDTTNFMFLNYPWSEALDLALNSVLYLGGLGMGIIGLFFIKD